MRSSARDPLQKEAADIKIVGEAEDGEKGLLLIKRYEPDVALVDVHMPGISCVERTERLRRTKSPTKVVSLTVASEAHFHGGCSKRRLRLSHQRVSSDELIKAIRQVADGKRCIGRDVAQQLALATMGGESSPFENLSARELEIAIMLAKGLKANEIAKRLHLSEKTVARLFEKLEIDNVVSIANLAAVHGLLKNPDALWSRMAGMPEMQEHSGVYAPGFFVTRAATPASARPCSA